MTTIKEKIPSEHHEQALLVQWFRRTYPSVLIHSIPNGGHRSQSTAIALKVEGTVKGIPDLFIPAWKVWVEMKRIKGGVLSPDQKNIIIYLESVGYQVIVGKGFLHAKEQIEQLIIKN
jgi:VRR-NUC domain